MNGALIEIKGNWGHFKKPETNNNPLSHDFITKTALIGLIGAVLGIDRREMKQIFPQLSEEILYGVSIVNTVKKESWGFTLRSVTDQFYKSPRPMEFLKNPHYIVAIAIASERSMELVNRFFDAVEHNEACFTPVLGLHNCPADLHFITRGSFKKENGTFSTKSFVTEKHKIDMDVTKIKEFRFGVERIPTYQNNDFWNLPEQYQKVIYPSQGREISAIGEYFEFKDQSRWVLI